MAAALAALMFPAVLVLLPLGFPVAFTVLGVAIMFAAIGQLFGVFDFHLLAALPLRIFDLMDNDLLQAIPLFIYLGAVMERTKLSRDLFTSLGALVGGRPGGLAVATLLLGLLLAPTTGAIGATVVSLGLLALPPMLAAGYERRFAVGLTAAVGTLGTVLPPSIVVLILADQMRIVIFDAQRTLGVASTSFFRTTSLFQGMAVPAALAVVGYSGIVLWRAMRRPASVPAAAVRVSLPRAFVNIAPPLAIIGSTLFLILTGRVYTVEAAGAAAVALTGWALVRRELSPRTLGEITRLVMRISGAMFLLIMGANTFSLVFRGFGGDRLTRELITQSFSSVTIAVPVVFLVLLGFGFFLDALEMLFLVAPIALPPLIVLGGDPLWIAVLFGLTLQTSFLLPPAGYALFFIDNVCRNVAPEITMPTIIRGTRPFAILQGAILALVMLVPALATWLPGR